MYTGILEIDTSDDPDVNTSNTNFVYDNTTIFLSTMSYNSNYFIMLTWEGTTIIISHLSLTFTLN